MNRLSTLRLIEDSGEVRRAVEAEVGRSGGIFRLAPAWVGRPGIVVPGRRIKLRDDYMSQSVAVNERWLASATKADNGAYNAVCPPDHGLSYLVIGDARVTLRDALSACPDLLLGPGKRWDVLPKFFDNWHRIPNHLHPCDAHCSGGLVGKPESYYFPEELNMDRNAFPITYFGVDPSYGDRQILSYLKRYPEGDNRLSDLGNAINLAPGTGWFMPPCTLHAPGSLVTYELQTASDVTCIPESRVNDMVMPADLLDRDIPAKLSEVGIEGVARYILSMIRCENSGNSHNFRQEYFRPPVPVFEGRDGSQHWVVYRTGRASAGRSPDLYSAKKTTVQPGAGLRLSEKGAFGAIVLGGSGTLRVPGREACRIENVAMFPDRDSVGGDEFFVSAAAAGDLEMECSSMESLRVYQHFASGTNPEAGVLEPPEYLPFG
jgi:hypothetical protein